MAYYDENTFDITQAELDGANRGQRPDLLADPKAVYVTPNGKLYSPVGGVLTQASVRDARTRTNQDGVFLGIEGPRGELSINMRGGRVNAKRYLTDWTNGAMGAASGSAGATAAVDPTTLHDGKPMMKYTMGSAGTFQATFTFTEPVTLAQLKTMQVPIRINRNTLDDGSANVWGTATLWFNTSSGGRVQLALNGLSGWRSGATNVLSMAPGAAAQGWSFAGGPTDTSVWDADASTVSSINFVVVVNAGREEGESIWIGPISVNSRREGVVCIDIDGPYTSADRWMLPMLEAQGLVARLNLNHLNVGQPGYMTYPQIDRAYAAGHSCGSHLYQASIGNGYSDFADQAAIQADISAGYANLAQRGYHRDNYTHVRGGSVHDHSGIVPMTKQRAIDAAHLAAGTKAIRYGSILGGAYTRLQPITGDFDPLNVQGAIQVSSSTTAADIIAVIDRAEARGELAIILLHRSVVATPGSLEITNANLDTAMSYLGDKVRSGRVRNETFGAALRIIGAIQE